MSTDRPNIMLVMSDQHSKHIAGCYGDSVASTPNMDALAKRGVVFDNAYCPFPLCSPTRMGFMTGRNPSEVGVYGNSDILDSHHPTFAHALGKAGYDVILCGRMHFNGPDQRHGFQRRIFPEVSGRAAGTLRNTNGFGRVSLEVSGPGRNHYLLYDELCTAQAVDWLRTRGQSSSNRPFCLVVGLVGPHCPFVCPPELFEKYFDRIDAPMLSDEELARMHPYCRRMRERSQILDATEHEVRRTRAAYYGMIDFDDQLLGSMIQALDDAGLADHTMTIYTSDHGDVAGEHGMWWKMSFYEGSVGVPLIASMPGAMPEGMREAAPVSLIDLAPTFTELTNAPAIPHATGVSIMPSLRGQALDPSRAAFSELFTREEAWATQSPSGGPARMIRQGKWKCTYYHNEPPQLFDLDSDPNELHDLAADPVHKSVLDGLLADILEGWDPEAHLAQKRRLAEQREFMRGAPSDPATLAGEYWQGPIGYGCVDAV